MLLLERRVIETIAWADVFSMPLTEGEVWRLLWSDTPYTYVEVRHTLLHLVDTQTLQYVRGYYVLNGREDIVGLRDAALPLVNEKILIARRAARWMRFVPFVQAVFVCNTVGMGHPKKESDIDVLIVVRSGRLYLTRFFVSGLLTILGVRRTKNKIKNRICLSFYITEDAVDLSVIALRPIDIYLSYWLEHLVPVYDPQGNTAKQLFFANRTLRVMIPHSQRPVFESALIEVGDSRLSGTCKRILERLWQGKYGDLIEEQAKKIQTMKMERNQGSVQKSVGTHVVISDSMLKFHEQDRRQMYLDTWIRRVHEVLPS